MTVSMACYCDGLPAHSHVYRHEPITDTQGRIVGVNYRPDEFDVHVWVDWKAVAREAS